MGRDAVYLPALDPIAKLQARFRLLGSSLSGAGVDPGSARCRICSLAFSLGVHASGRGRPGDVALVGIAQIYC
jgi:hypothetical protein